jgi:hypothetical protein
MVTGSLSIMKTFSTNALAELLERDRATIVRALRKVPPDATERKQPRWKMTTAIAAVDASPGSHNSPARHRNDNSGSVDPRVTALIDPCSDAIYALQEMPLHQRREVAKAELGPMIKSTFHDLQDLIDECRAESIWNLWLNVTMMLCFWTHEGGWDFLVTANDDLSEAELADLAEHRAAWKKTREDEERRIKQLQQEHR